MISKESAEDMAELTQLVERGQLRPLLERTFELPEAAEAIDHIANGHARGKVAITI